jgi:hypothetical protein
MLGNMPAEAHCKEDCGINADDKSKVKNIRYHEIY